MEKTSFESFIERFFSRYTEAEFRQDLAAVADGADEELLANAQKYFSKEKTREAYREAVLSVRLAGVSTRTIRNWKRGENIYSERSSRALNAYFNQHLPTGARISRRKLAWLWLASRLKMTDEEANLFFRDCMGERRIYGLDPHETVLRTALVFNSVQPDAPWDFFDAVSFSLALYEQVTEGEALIEAFRERAMAVLAGADGDARQTADALSLLYEEALGEMREVTQSPVYSQAVTRVLEERWAEDYTQLISEQAGAAGIAETKERLQAWALTKQPFFRAAYLSWFLTITGLLAGFASRSQQEGSGEGLYADWYYSFSSLLAAGEGAADFPADVYVMEDAYAYEEGEEFSRFVKEKCLTYFGRLYDAPLRLARSRLLEFAWVARGGQISREELDAFLTRHSFRPLESGEQPQVTDKLFRWTYRQPL